MILLKCYGSFMLPLVTIALCAVIEQDTVAALSFEEAIKDFYESITRQRRSMADSDEKIVEKCFYDHYWLTVPKHHCHVVAYGGSKPRFWYSFREMKLRIMFQKLIRRDREDRQLVKECFELHRFDKVDKCLGISWDAPQRYNSSVKQLSLRDQRKRKLWKDLVREEYDREMRCRNHPWMDFDDC